MTRIVTAHGLGELINTETVRGRTSYLVKGAGFQVWCDAADVHVAADEGGGATPLFADTFEPYKFLDPSSVMHGGGTEGFANHTGTRYADNFDDEGRNVNEDNSTVLPWDPTPQQTLDSFGDEQTILPGDFEIDPDERLSPSDSRTFNDESANRPYPGPDPKLFAGSAYRYAEGEELEAQGGAGNMNPGKTPVKYPSGPVSGGMNTVTHLPDLGIGGAGPFGDMTAVRHYAEDPAALYMDDTGERDWDDPDSFPQPPKRPSRDPGRSHSPNWRDHDPHYRERDAAADDHYLDTDPAGAEWGDDDWHKDLPDGPEAFEKSAWGKGKGPQTYTPPTPGLQPTGWPENSPAGDDGRDYTGQPRNPADAAPKLGPGEDVVYPYDKVSPGGEGVEEMGGFNGDPEWYHCEDCGAWHNEFRHMHDRRKSKPPSSDDAYSPAYKGASILPPRLADDGQHSVHFGEDPRDQDYYPAEDSHEWLGHHPEGEQEQYQESPRHAASVDLGPRYASIPDAPVHDPFFRNPLAFMSRQATILEGTAGLNPRIGEYMDLVLADKGLRTAAWRDVRSKAMRLRREGRVKTVKSSPEAYYGSVEGDSGTYDTIIVRGNALDFGGQSVTAWHCGCDWGQWAFKRRLTYVGRFCSHAYASYMEMQSLHDQPGGGGTRMKPKRRKKRSHRHAGIVEDFKKWAEENDQPTGIDSISNFIAQPTADDEEERRYDADEVDQLYSYVQDNLPESPEREFDVPYTFDRDKVYKNADALRMTPRSLTPALQFVPEGEDEHFTDVTQDDRKTTGPGQITTDKTAGWDNQNPHGKDSFSRPPGGWDDDDVAEKSSRPPGGWDRSAEEEPEIEHFASILPSWMRHAVETDPSTGGDFGGALPDAPQAPQLGRGGGGSNPEAPDLSFGGGIAGEEDNPGIVPQGMGGGASSVGDNPGIVPGGSSDSMPTMSGGGADFMGDNLGGSAGAAGDNLGGSPDESGSTFMAYRYAETDEDHEVHSTGEAAGNLDDLRDLIQEPLEDSYGEMDERNDEVRDLVDELHDQGVDANNLVARRRRATAPDGSSYGDERPERPDVLDHYQNFADNLWGGDVSHNSLDSYIKRNPHINRNDVGKLLQLVDQHIDGGGRQAGVREGSGGFWEPGGPDWMDEPFQGSGADPKDWYSSSDDYIDKFEKDNRQDVTDLGDGDTTRYNDSSGPVTSPRQAAMARMQRQADAFSSETSSMEPMGGNIDPPESTDLGNDTPLTQPEDAGGTIAMRYFAEDGYHPDNPDPMAFGPDPEMHSLTPQSEATNLHGGAGAADYGAPMRSAPGQVQTARRAPSVRDSIARRQRRVGWDDSTLPPGWGSSPEEQDDGGQQPQGPPGGPEGEEAEGAEGAMGKMAPELMAVASQDGDSDILRAFHATAGAAAIKSGRGGSGGGGGRSDVDIAGAAAQFLQRTAGRNYSPAQQAELVDEYHPEGARNLASLDLQGTHYVQ